MQNIDNGIYSCATIVTTEDNIDHLAEARFNGPIAGSIIFRWLTAKDTIHRENLITSSLFHITNITESNSFTSHSWKIFVTDILETNADKTQVNCNVLQLIYDPDVAGAGKSLGDIDVRVGQIQIAKNVHQKQTKQLFVDQKLILLPSDLTSPHRQLFAVVYDHLHTNRFLACAKIQHIRPRIVK